MNRFLIAILALVGLSATSCAQQENEKVVVAYFSATGTTETVAQTLATATDAVLYEIVPAVAYTAEDLDWRNEASRSSVEMGDAASRPETAGTVENIGQYDIVFLGYPIWWNQAPRIVNTFIEQHNLQGKRVILFATSGSSTIDNSISVLKATYPDIDWQEGCLMNGATEQTIADWGKSFLKK